MITKGSNEYRKASVLANNIFDMANTDRSYGELRWSEREDNIFQVTSKVEKTNGFASEVAKTVKASIKSWGEGYQVARCSSKQAWIIACAVIENNIELF